MKKSALFMFGLVVGASVLLSACLGQSGDDQKTSMPTPAANSAGSNNSVGAPAADGKKGETVKYGTLSKIGESYYLQETGRQPIEVDSYAVDFSAYVGKTVKVSGQYSGDTLFVGSIMDKIEVME